jgi:hypothetical protein
MDTLEQKFEHQDYLLYFQSYDEAKTVKRKPRNQATEAGDIQHTGQPLDFSFLKLQDVQALKKERPRAGVRKPIEKEEDEEDSKKEQSGPAVEEKLDDKDKAKSD